MKAGKTRLVATGLARYVCIACSFLLLNAGLSAGTEAPFESAQIFRLLTGQRLVLGTVEEIRSQEVRLNIGNVMPRFLSLKQAEDKRQMTPRVGDVLVLVINDQNNVLEYHVYGEENWHILMNGKLLKPIPPEQGWALIQDGSGKVTITPINADARENWKAFP